MRARALGLVILAVVALSSAQAQVVDQTGDLKADLFSKIPYPRTDGSYRIPSQTDLVTWRAAVEAALGGDLDTAAQLLSALAPSYKAVRFTDTSGSPPVLYHLILEADVTPDGLVPTVVVGWGSYFFNPAPQRELSIQAPHPVFDSLTQNEGIDAFLQLQARSFLLAGTHRCASNTETPCSGTTTACSADGSEVPYRVSDPAHGASPANPTVTNTLEIVHEAVFGFMPQTVALQFHGNSVSSCRAVHVLLSNTGSDFNVTPDGNLQRLKASLDLISDRTLTVQLCDHPPGAGECNRCGTNNLQGRWTNGSLASPCTADAPAASAEQFIHIEQNLEMRQLHQDALIQAIASTTFQQEQGSFAAASGTSDSIWQAGLRPSPARSNCPPPPSRKPAAAQVEP